MKMKTVVRGIVAAVALSAGLLVQSGPAAAVDLNLGCGKSKLVDCDVQLNFDDPLVPEGEVRFAVFEDTGEGELVFAQDEDGDTEVSGFFSVRP